jgi:hypothetical protein
MLPTLDSALQEKTFLMGPEGTINLKIGRFLHLKP